MIYTCSRIFYIAIVQNKEHGEIYSQLQSSQITRLIVTVVPAWTTYKIVLLGFIDQDQDWYITLNIDVMWI